VIELSIRLEWFPCAPSYGKRRMGVCGYEFFWDRILLYEFRFRDSQIESRKNLSLVWA
jgi:hypothetical protein